jgi:hypothetical protein
MSLQAASPEAPKAKMGDLDLLKQRLAELRTRNRSNTIA